jgi:ATP phosphoribosyltransferase regulatory subunit
MRNWLLPEYIEDILPRQARRIELLRSRLMALYRGYGYQLVIPPLLEYLESLLTGSGEDLDLRTFKILDQMSGRMMGVRADITPQVARVDAHLLNRSGITRLCYSGSTVHARPRGLNSTREPLQIGAEIYGHSGIESDLEVQDLLRKSLDLIGLKNARFDLGHVAIFRDICSRGGISGEQERSIHAALQAKDLPCLQSDTANLNQVTRDAILNLPLLYGDRSVLDLAAQRLPRYPAILSALDELDKLSANWSGQIGIDLSDLRGYHYHSGVLFAAYFPGQPNAIALGGRYDEVGKSFGRARPATGFSMDLRELSGISDIEDEQCGILAPFSDDPELAETIDELRMQGSIVIVNLPGHDKSVDELGCDQELVRIGAKWQVRKLK